MGCRSSNLAVMATQENAPAAAAAAVVAAAQFIMVNPGDTFEKDLNFLKTNGYQKLTNTNVPPNDENILNNNNNKNSDNDNNNNNTSDTVIVNGKSGSMEKSGSLDEGKSRRCSSSIVRVKNGIITSSYAQYRKPIPNVSIWKFLKAGIDKVVEKHGQDHEWLVEVAKTSAITFSGLELQTRKLASAFHKLKVNPHDVVIVMTSNTKHTYLLILALWRLNIAVRICSPEENYAEILVRYIKESNAVCIICDGGTSKTVHEAYKKSPVPLFIISMEPLGLSERTNVFEMMHDDGEEFPGDLEDYNVDVNNDVIYIPCTSGASGTGAKTVMHTHKTLIAGLMQGSFFHSVSTRYTMMPMRVYHLSGMMWPLALLLKGQSCLLIDVISTNGIYEAIQQRSPGAICGFPSFLITLALKFQDLGLSCPSVTAIMTSGETISKSGLEKLKMVFPNIKQLDVSYLMAEILMTTSSVPYHDFEQGESLSSNEGRIDHKIGYLCCYSSAKVVDPETGACLGPNQSGELCFRAPSIMKGYVGVSNGEENGNETKQTLNNVWIHTGDCGYYDVSGMFYVTGRLNEVFKCDGEYVSPLELESVLLDHPDVTTCVVVGVPDEEAGTVPCAVISRRFGATTNATEIKEFFDSQVQEHQQLKGGVIFMDSSNDIPKTKTGKISRSEVLRMVLNIQKMKKLKQ